MAGDGSSSGEKGVVKKKVHHLNPRRRNKLKVNLPEQELTEEEKRRRNEQKKRRELAMKLRAEGKTYSSETFNRKKRKAAFKGEGGQGGRPKKKIKVKSSQRNKAPYNVIILPIAWHQRKEESARILAAAETAEQLLAAAGITSRIDDTDNYTPGQKMKYWELRGVRVRLEIGPKESLSGTAVLALAAGAPGEVAAKSSVKIKEPGLSERIKAALIQLGEKLGQQQQQQGEKQQQQGKEGKGEGAGVEQQQGQEGQKPKKRAVAAADGDDAAAGEADEQQQQQQHKKQKQKKQRDGEDAAAAAAAAAAAGGGGGGDGSGRKGQSKEEREQQRAAAKAKLKQHLSALVAEEVSHDEDGGDDSADDQPGSKQQQQQQPANAKKQPQKAQQQPAAAAAAAAAVFESADALEDDFEFLAGGGEDGKGEEGAAAAAGRPGKKFQNKQRGRKPAAAAAAAAGGSADVQVGLSAGWPDGGGAKRHKKSSKVVKF